jgi:hypothetical protein
VVAIDPRRDDIPAGETAEVRFFDPRDPKMMSQISCTGRVVSLARFYSVQVNDQKTVDWINNLPLADQLTVRL